MAKEIRKTIRFSSEEYSKIEELMSEHNLTFAEFARGAILKKKIKLPIERELLYQLNKIGNNLNQIAKRINQKEKFSVLTELVQIEKSLKDLK
jgi:hypothetical protein